MNPARSGGYVLWTTAPLPVRWIGAALLFLALAFSNVIAAVAPVPGHVEAWGHNFFGQSTPPAGLDGVVAVAAGGEHSLALLTNGMVVAWGANFEGQTVVPQGLNSVKAIAAGNHCVALKSDGMVVVWGSSHAVVTNLPAGLNGVAAIAAAKTGGNTYTLAVRSNGTVVAWGLDTPATNVPAGLSGVVAVSPGNDHALALKNDGTVVGWGGNNAGQASAPSGLSGVIAVAAGQSSSLAVKSDGTVVKWGSFDNVPAGLDGVVDVKLGASHALALRSNGVAVAWGFNGSGQTAVPAGLTGVTAISAGGNHNLVVTARPLIISISPPVTSNPGDLVTFSVNASGAPLSYQWRRNGADLLGATNSSLMIASAQASDAGVYTVLVSNPYGSTLSPSTSLAFPPPLITSQPQSVTRYRGESASFNVVASGVAPLSYQWLKASASLPGATAATLALTNVRSTNAGSYQAIATDAAGQHATSAVATLTIIDPTLTSSVTLTPVADTSIYASGANPQGAGSILAGTRHNGIVDRGLMRFNLTSIPTIAVIQSADLRLTVTKVPRNPANSNFSLYRMFRFWGLDATWANATAGVLWSTPGGLSGTDYSASSSATQFVTGGGVYDFGPSSQLVADIQTWVTNPGTNHGWIFKTESEGSFGSARHFGSSESTQPPQLLLQYATPAPPARLTNVIVQTGNLMFRFDGVSGWFYRVECRDDVEKGVWTTVTNVPAGPAHTIIISIPTTGPRRFFRVIAE